jgi:hypothetical protein
MARDYKRENKYKAQPEQIKARVYRNRARRMMIAAGKAKVGDGKQVDHNKPITKGGKKVMSNLRVVTPAANDSFKRNSKRQLVSQTSTLEARKGWKK